MEAIADMDSFERLDLSENRWLRFSFCAKQPFLFETNLPTWQCNYIFPNNKDYFVAKCNHIVKSNKKWLWLNNFRLARLAAPLLAAALNKVFKIVLLNSHQGHDLRKSWLISFLLKVTISENHDWLFFSRLAWWLSSNVVSLTISWRLCWKRRDYKEGGLDKNPNFKESKIQNPKYKEGGLNKNPCNSAMSFLICNMNINKFQDKGILHRRKQYRMFAQEAPGRFGKVIFFFYPRLILPRCLMGWYKNKILFRGQSRTKQAAKSLIFSSSSTTLVKFSRTKKNTVRKMCLNCGWAQNIVT